MDPQGLKATRRVAPTNMLLTVPCRGDSTVLSCFALLPQRSKADLNAPKRDRAGCAGEYDKQKKGPVAGALNNIERIKFTELLEQLQSFLKDTQDLNRGRSSFH